MRSGRGEPGSIGIPRLPVPGVDGPHVELNVRADPVAAELAGEPVALVGVGGRVAPPAGADRCVPALAHRPFPDPVCNRLHECVDLGGCGLTVVALVGSGIAGHRSALR